MNRPISKKISLIFASANSHKAEELSQLLDQQVLALAPAPRKLEVLEDSGQFQGNALLKANAYYEEFKSPVLADDSGLVVEALPDELGVESANFGGPLLTDRQRAELLLLKMKDVSPIKRTAYFVCHLCFFMSPNEVFFFEGRMKGSIGTEYRSGGGFGYDPVFIPEKGELGKSLAEQSDWKQLHSHRALAAQAANHFFRKGIANFR